MKMLSVFIALLFLYTGAFAQASVVQFIFTSDVHFGLQKEVFRGEKNVPAYIVNDKMVQQMNLLPEIILPIDGGLNNGKKIGPIDAVIITGDIANREENGVQSAADSWKQFTSVFIERLKIRDKAGIKAKLLLTPGNHDISNAIGFHRPMVPATDPSSMVGIYNLMMQTAQPKTNASFHYPADKIHYSRNIGGIHFVFVDAWPDSAERVWMEKDLLPVKSTTPVFLFTHSLPDVEARFFTNPNGDHSVNEKDKFENLVMELFKDGVSVEDKAILEEKALALFIQKHPNIKAYFHGHNNFTEYYQWKGPDQTISLPCFRADSPMKGRLSSKDETKLAFELVTVDTESKTITVRECLWNTHPADPVQTISWGMSTTLSLE